MLWVSRILGARQLLWHFTCTAAWPLSEDMVTGISCLKSSSCSFRTSCYCELSNLLVELSNLVPWTQISAEDKKIRSLLSLKRHGFGNHLILSFSLHFFNFGCTAWSSGFCPKQVNKKWACWLAQRVREWCLCVSLHVSLQFMCTGGSVVARGVCVSSCVSFTVWGLWRYACIIPKQVDLWALLLKASAWLSWSKWLRVRAAFWQ